MFKAFLTRLLRASFARNVGVLTSGTVVAQGLAVLAMPILTRMYSPADFNLLAIFVSATSLAGVIACLRYNIAIPIPDGSEDGMNLLALSLLATATFAIVFAVIVILMPEQIGVLFNSPEISAYLWLAPIGILMSGSYDALQYWASRKKQFVLITKTRVSRAVGGVATQLGFGAVAPSPFGLIIGQVIYSAIGVVRLVVSVLRLDRNEVRRVTSSSMRRTAFQFRRFPLLSVPEALLNTGGTELPVLIIAAVAAGPEAAFLMLAVRLMGMPMALIGSSVAQVFLVEAAEKRRARALAEFTRKTMWTLLKLGAPPLILAGALSPFLFRYVFGDEWERAGVLVAWATPWFILHFVSSPVSMVIHAIGEAVTALLLQLAGFIIRVGTVLLATAYAPSVVSEAYALSGALFYGLYLLTVLFLLRRSEHV